MLIFWNALKYHAIFNAIFYFSSFLTFLADILHLLTKYKMQQSKVDKVIQVYKKIIPTVLFNTLVGVFPLFIVACFFMNFMDYSFSVYKLVFDLIAAPILTDILFFFCHKLLHKPIIYKHFHKKHHEITAPIGMSAVYMTLTDLYIGNIVPVFLPLILLSSHSMTFTIWVAIVTINTIIFAHSGYKYIADFHDIHHSHFKYNFGINLFMDKIMGTHLNAEDIPKKRLAIAN